MWNHPVNYAQWKLLLGNADSLLVAICITISSVATYIAGQWGDFWTFWGQWFSWPKVWWIFNITGILKLLHWDENSAGTCASFNQLAKYLEWSKQLILLLQFVSFARPLPLFHWHEADKAKSDIPLKLVTTIFQSAMTGVVQQLNWKDVGNFMWGLCCSPWNDDTEGAASIMSHGSDDELELQLDWELLTHLDDSLIYCDTIPYSTLKSSFCNTGCIICLFTIYLKCSGHRLLYLILIACHCRLQNQWWVCT